MGSSKNPSGAQLCPSRFVRRQQSAEAAPLHAQFSRALVYACAGGVLKPDANKSDHTNLKTLGPPSLPCEADSA